MTSPDATASQTPAPDAAAATTPNAAPRLFGRKLLYVAIWSMQLVAATVVSPILTHRLGPVEFGAIASAIALHQVFTALALLGLDQALVLQRSGDDDGAKARGLIAVGVATSVTVMFLIGVTAPLWEGAFGFGEQPTLVLAVVLWTAPAAAVQVMLSLLLAEDRIRPFAVISALSAVGGLVIGLALLFTVHNDAVTYLTGGIIAQLAAMLIGFAVTRPRLRGLVDWRITLRALRLGVPLAIGGLSYFVLNAGDRVVIQRMLGPAEVGRYQVAYVIGSVVILLLTFTSAAWTPQFAALRDEGERWALAARSRDELYRLLAPMTIGVALGAPVVLRAFAPASFRPESLLTVVVLVALAAFPVAAAGATGRLLIVLRRGTMVGLITAIAAAANVGLNLLLIPVIGIAGSAAATLLAYVVLAVLQRLALPSTPHYARPPARLVRMIALSVLVAASSTLLPQSSEWNWARFAAAVACLPWFVLSLLRARRGAPADEGPADEGPPVEGPDAGPPAAVPRQFARSSARPALPFVSRRNRP